MISRFNRSTLIIKLLWAGGIMCIVLFSYLFIYLLPQLQAIHAYRQSLKNIMQYIETLSPSIIAHRAVYKSDLISAEQASEAIEGLLTNNADNLTLTEIRKLPPLRMGQLYVHPFNMTLVGDYRSTLDYLKKLKDSPTPLPLYWRSIDYHVTQYPNAKIQLRFSSLSLDPNWYRVMSDQSPAQSTSNTSPGLSSATTDAEE